MHSSLKRHREHIPCNKDFKKLLNYYQGKKNLKILAVIILILLIGNAYKYQICPVCTRQMFVLCTN